jgi:hypothetical protein
LACPEFAPELPNVLGGTCTLAEAVLAPVPDTGRFWPAPLIGWLAPRGWAPPALLGVP